MKKSFTVYLPALFFPLFLLGIVPPGFSETLSATAIKSAGEGEVLIEKGKISVDVRDNLLGEVLKQIAAQCNIWIKGNESVLREKVSIRFEDLSLEQGMKRILSRFNSCLMFDLESKLTGVIIIGSQNASTSAFTPPDPVEVINEVPEILRATENAPVPEILRPTENAPVPEILRATENAPVPEILRATESAPVPEILRPTENAPAPKIALQATDEELEQLRPDKKAPVDELTP